LNTIIQEQVGGLVMDVDKKEQWVRQLEGLEEWMTQFIIDPILDGCEDGIRMELFETELSFIVEATVPGIKKEDIGIEVEKNGIHFKFKKNNCTTDRFVVLPVSLCKRIIDASYHLEIVELTIQKSGEVKKHIRNIEIK
jgi:HSP20 family protein